MKMRGLGRIQRVARRIRNRWFPGGLILMYHRVADLPTDPFNLCVAPHHFAEHLAVLNQQFRPMSLQQMVWNVQEGKDIKRAIAITFDDGYADNLFNAKPLLEKYGVPATVFVTTGNLEQPREFWWDELERIFLQPGTLPRFLSLDIRSNTYCWDLGPASNYREADFQQNCTWSWYVPEQADPSLRHTVYRSLYSLLNSLPYHDRQRVLDELLQWSGVSGIGRSTHRSLTATEVHTLGRGNLVEVGAHTVNHPFLSVLSIAAQQSEIQQSKVLLESIMNGPVNSFAYPHGNYASTTIDLVRQAGFRCACSTISNQIRHQSDCFQLPRFEVKNWDGETFSKTLTQWFQHSAP